MLSDVNKIREIIFRSQVQIAQSMMEHVHAHAQHLDCPLCDWYQKMENILISLREVVDA